MKTLILPLLAIGLMAHVGSLLAGERPPQGAKKLSEIVAMLEESGYGPISEISMDRGKWEIETWRNNEERELKVDAVTGEILSDRRD